MLIAEDLVLLTLEDFSGRPVSGLSAQTLELLAGGALVSELALSGAVYLRPDPVTRMLEVHPTGVRIPQDPLLQHCLAFAGGNPRPASLVRRCGIDMYGHLADRLVHRGLLRRDQQKRFLITRTTWPAVEVTYKQDVRRHLGAALFDGVHPTRRTAALIGHLAAVEQIHRLFGSPTAFPTDVMDRADHVSRGDWAATTVRGIFRSSRRRGDWFGGGEGGWGGDGGGGDGGGGGGGGDGGGGG
ncbi:GPP34 family phosphoprotein [Nocardioides sp. NPDC101246]|uniref:GOLPH3/VPS74 family protein n=1 Tax=Nocardioides sp. NPDC101246 TaxID=3364336 RepID=UPI003800F122